MSSLVLVRAVEKEALSRGLEFGLPQRKSREDILAEFEGMHRQLKRHQPSSKEAADICRTRLAGIAEEYLVTPNNCEGFSWQKEYFNMFR